MNIGPAAVGIVSGIIGLAIVSVIVSKNAQTPNVLQATGSALAKVIQAAVSPVSAVPNNGNLGASTYSTTFNSLASNLTGLFGQ